MQIPTFAFPNNSWKTAALSDPSVPENWFSDYKTTKF